jgi:hypothetical protein
MKIELTTHDNTPSPAGGAGLGRGADLDKTKNQLAS